MAKKKSWFNLVRRLFISEAKAKPDKKEKRWRWMFGRFKVKRLHVLAAASPTKERTLSEVEDEQNKHAMTVAIATAVAAEAAVAAAQAAAEVVRLRGTSKSYALCEGRSREWAAIKIQTAFRGYLARKALRALKALVKLQAIVRGRAVRRQAMTTLKSLQSLVKIQSQVRAKRLGIVEDNWTGEEQKELIDPNKELEDMGTRLGKLRLESQRRWGDSLLTKEETNSMFLSKQDAMIKRERIKRYSYSHQERRRRESEPNNVDGMLSNWLDHWVDTQAWKQEQLENFDRIAYLNAIDKDVGVVHLRPREIQKHEDLLGMNSPLSLPRRSFHQSNRSYNMDNDLFSGFSALPSYMAATESAKAKVRSISTPRQRLGAADAYSDHGSPSKSRHSFCSTNGSDATFINRICKPSGCQQRSPRIRGISAPIKSYQTSKDLSLDSIFSLQNWDQHKAFG